MANKKHTYPDELFDLLPDINEDDPHFAVALLAAVERWRRCFNPDNFNDNRDLLRYYTDNTIQVRESFPSTYGEDIQLGEVPHTKSPYDPTYDDVYLLERCIEDIVAAERESGVGRVTAKTTPPKAADAPQNKPDDGGDIKINPDTREQQWREDAPEYTALNLATRTIKIGTEIFNITSEKVWDFIKDLYSNHRDDRLVPALEGATNNKNNVDQLRRLIKKDNLHKIVLSVRGGYKLNPQVNILSRSQIGIKNTHLKRV